MTLKAVIFGSIGSFSETSRIQLESFNEALLQNGLKQQWDEKEYIEFLKIQGGINRLKIIFPENSPQVLEMIHSEKTRLFQQKLAEGESFLRIGFEAFCEMLLQNNILIGLASTTFLESIEAILKSLNTISRENFTFIGHQGLTQRQKPDPEIYEMALREMGVKKDEVLAFEDTRLSLMSPMHAGIKTIAIPGELSSGQDFSEATLVIQQYSDLDLERLNEFFFLNKINELRENIQSVFIGFWNLMICMESKHFHFKELDIIHFQMCDSVFFQLLEGALRCISKSSISIFPGFHVPNTKPLQQRQPNQSPKCPV